MSKYPCPQCQKKLTYDSSNEFRPFCSHRCQQIDLGAWANEEYSIVGDELENDFSSALLESAETQD
jgi:hypothetical protein